MKDLNGFDYKYRCKVDNRYMESMVNKARLKYSVVIHSFLATLILLEIIVYHFEWKLNDNEDIPGPKLWHYIWLTSIVPAIVSLTTLSRNNYSLLKYCYYGVLSLGLCTSICVILINAPVLYDYVMDKESTNLPLLFGSIPILIIWYFFLAIAIQVHVLSLFFISQLLGCWKERKSS
ncbi:hypothetical protein SNEBB_009485 [Seison nebaliae]|nr:hypothetical protein SNEBB_009485 [Seison nebaliae]